MWIREYRQLFKDVKKEAVWALWKDVNHWSVSHDDLDYCQMTGEFAVGNFFMLKPKKASELIEAQQHLKIHSISLLEQGWDNVVYCVNKEHIFRLGHSGFDLSSGMIFTK
jgi:hypothetical protein